MAKIIFILIVFFFDLAKKKKKLITFWVIWTHKDRMKKLCFWSTFIQLLPLVDNNVIVRHNKDRLVHRTIIVIIGGESMVKLHIVCYVWWMGRCVLRLWLANRCCCCCCTLFFSLSRVLHSYSAFNASFPNMFTLLLSMWYLHQIPSHERM